MDSFVEDVGDTDGQDRDEWGACQEGDADTIAGGHCSHGVAGRIGDLELRADHFKIVGMIFYDGMRWIGEVIVLLADYGAAGEADDEKEADEAGLQVLGLWVVIKIGN